MQLQGISLSTVCFAWIALAAPFTAAAQRAICAPTYTPRDPSTPRAMLWAQTASGEVQVGPAEGIPFDVNGDGASELFVPHAGTGLYRVFAREPASGGYQFVSSRQKFYMEIGRASCRERV